VPVAALHAMNDAQSARTVIDLSEADIAGLHRAWGLARIVVELADEGEVMRELGYDELGRLIHRWPGGQSRAADAVFDVATFDRPTRSDMPGQQFDQLWKDAIEEEGFFDEHDPYGDRFASSVPWWGCVGALMVVGAVTYFAFF
jgi:hypothetical protein